MLIRHYKIKTIFLCMTIEDTFSKAPLLVCDIVNTLKNRYPKPISY